MSAEIAGSRIMRTESVVQLETVADHLTGEEIGLAIDFLNDMPEVLDAIWLPGIGKKNRPCGVLQVLCLPENEEIAVRAIFRHTHSLGVRRMPLQRYVLPRETGMLEKDGEPLAAKIYELDGRVWARPEADAIREKACERGMGAPAYRISEKERKI